VTELAKRVASALVLAPLAIGAVYWGDAALATFLGAAAAAGAWEFYRMARAGGAPAFETSGIVLAGATPLVAHAHQLRLMGGPGSPIPPIPAVAPLVAVLALLAAAIWRRGVDGRPLVSVAATVLGVVYVAVPLAYGYALRYHEYAVGRAAGTAVVLFPVVLTWASDIGGYFVGRLAGRRKLIPAVSPGKTVEGALGGLALTVVAALAYERLALRPLAQLGMAPWWAAAFGLVVSVAAQLGDLVESLLKREAGVKDSSRLIPGHGGVLDRVDSLLFVLPVAYLLLGWLLLPAPARA
jgi:phosphatidate cytidylyltransferase